MSDPTVTPLVVLSEVGGCQWRLAMDEPTDHHQPLVRLERLEPIFGAPAWVHVKHVTADLAEVGVERRGAGIMFLDDKKAKFRLRIEMSALGHAPADTAMPDPAVWTPEIDGHVRANLVQLLLEMEAIASAATPGEWRPADAPVSIGGPLALAVVNGAPGNLALVTLGMSPQDQAHVVATQPLVIGALCRKLRQAFYLLRDTVQLQLLMRQTIEAMLRRMVGGGSQDEIAACADLPMIDTLLAGSSARVADFPIIQIPTRSSASATSHEHGGPSKIDTGITRARALEIAFAAAGAHSKDPDSNKWPPEWVITAIIEASR